MTASFPDTAKGYMDDGGWDGYGGAVDLILEFNPELQGDRALRVYGQMRTDPQCAAILAAYIEPIMAGRYAVAADGCRDEVVQFIADELGLPVAGSDDKQGAARRRNFSFRKHLRTALMDQTFGASWFEQVWMERSSRWSIDTIQERMPYTIAEINLNPDGTINYIEQKERLRGRTTPPRITTADHRLVHYTREREGSNYWGRSLLRPAFPMWAMKNQVMQVHGESIRRFGMGILEVNAPTQEPGAVAEAQRYASNYRAGSKAGVGLPPGFTSQLKGLTGNVPDAVAFLNWLDRQMTRATLTSLLDMATSERGSRALGETVMDLMVLAQTSVAQQHVDDAIEQIVIPLVDANFGEDEAAPRIVVTDIGADKELTAEDVANLQRYGALSNGQRLDEWVRNRYGIPLETAETRAPDTSAAGSVSSDRTAGGNGDGGQS